MHQPSGSPHANSALSITFRVYNYARVPCGILIAAKRGTTAIFRKAGVETEWIDCQLARAGPHMPACDKPFTDLDLILRLLPSSMMGAFAPYEDSFGMALAGEGRSSTTAVIFYGQVPELARTGYADEKDILAAVMAHEIGHLLLGGTHSATGIMRAKWNREEVKLVGRGQLQFTLEQSLLIRNEVAARLERADGRSQ
jgi:hypothetical protein